jgi:hypothetical protein
MTMRAIDFRREVLRRRGSRRRGAPRYPEQLVAFAVQHVQAARAAGRSLHSASTELGLSAMTLGAWLSRSGDGVQKRLREVVVREPTAVAVKSSGGLEIRTPSGHVIRGLSVAEAAALLRALQ